jgi:hypothetical protein
MSAYVTTAAGFPFRYATPWALVERNGGHQLAYIVSAELGRDGLMAYRGYIWSETSQEYSKTVRPLSRERIRRFWRNPPSLDAIKRAKAAANKRLRRAERVGRFGRALRRAA